MLARRARFVVPLAVLMLATVVGWGSVPAEAATACQIWGSAPQPANPGATFNDLAAVAVVPSCSAWVVGSYQDGGHDKTLIERWNGTAWKIVPSPNAGTDSSLTSIAVTGPTNAWAVGQFFDGTNVHALVLRWNGKVWKVQPTAKISGLGSRLGAVVAGSSTQEWAVGDRYTATSQRELILHWNGHRGRCRRAQVS
jgi:hypothetical protein